MNGPENNYSRSKRKKKANRTNTIINVLIGIVVILIVITASMIFFGGSNDNKADENKGQKTEEPNGESKEDLDKEKLEKEKEDEKEPAKEDEEESSTEEELNEEESAEESGVLINKSPDDDYVKETILNTGWEPIGTKQKGEHVSLYDGTSDDWHEKIEAISYATGLSKDNMIIKKIRNGGNSQKSVGIVSSKSEDEKYRVYLDWVDDEGWIPVKMDILKTLDFNFDK